ncbi:MAG: cell division protein SepF [Bacilli bacterium]
MSIIKGAKDWFLGSDAEETTEFDDDFTEDLDFGSVSTSSFEGSTPKVGKAVEKMSFDSNKSSQMVVFEPRSFSESQGIADHLKGGRGCIINLHRVSKDQATRIIDFLSGITYAIEGEVQKIGSNVFLCTPSSFGVYGEISENE